MKFDEILGISHCSHIFNAGWFKKVHSEQDHCKLVLFNTEDEEHEVEILFKNFETFELKGVFGMLVELDFVVEIVEVFVLFVIGGGMTSAENTKREK